MGNLMATHGSHPTLDELATGPIDATDVEALARLAALYERSDPVPDGLVDRIQFGVTLDALEAEIAELQRTGELAGVRSGATDAQTVTFTSANLTTMVTITPAAADQVRIDGWVVPGAGVAVELRTQHETLHVTADGDGRFVFDAVRRGLAQFVLRREPTDVHRPVATPSIEL
jgi:hypothetical protein